jgi:hypothetical protein
MEGLITVAESDLSSHSCVLLAGFLGKGLKN